jgi:hypothetical protein
MSVVESVVPRPTLLRVRLVDAAEIADLLLRLKLEFQFAAIEAARIFP